MRVNITHINNKCSSTLCVILSLHLKLGNGYYHYHINTLISSTAGSMKQFLTRTFSSHFSI